MAFIDEIFGQFVYEFNFDQIKKFIKDIKILPLWRKKQMLREWAAVKGIELKDEDYKFLE